MATREKAEKELRVRTPELRHTQHVHAGAVRRAALFGAAMATLCGACTGPVGVPPDPTGPPPATTMRSAPGSSVAPGSPGASPGSSASPSGVIFHGRPGRHRIALTFDSNMTTAMLHRLDTGQVASYANDQVIDELEAGHTPATFFLSGLWVQRYPELTRRIAADPHFELASHSYAHQGFTAHCYGLGSIAAADMAADVERSFSVLAPYGGHQTRYFRFPGGCYDQAALAAIAPAHAVVVQYDIVGGDAFSHDTATIVDSVLNHAHDGAIVVMHITKANAPNTAEALPQIISGLQERGYRLVTLSQLLAPYSSR